MREYAVERIAALLQTFQSQLERAFTERDEDAIHDLRVSIRRLSEGLRVFRQFFPAAGRKKVRRRLKRLMDLAAAIRDRDIALQLLTAASLGQDSLAEGVRRERQSAEHDLEVEVRRWIERETTSKWPAKLGVAIP